jgi:anti-sigma regulatory factor (Ser/Thr protein kinase)
LNFKYEVVGKDFKRAGASSSGLRKTLKRLGLHPHVVRRIAIIAFEAEMNIVVFTDGGEISAEVEPGSVWIEARDEGPGIPDIAKAMKPGYSTAPDWVRERGFGAGMGLSNIKRCSDEMTVHSEVGKGTQVRMRVLTSETEPDN